MMQRQVFILQLAAKIHVEAHQQVYRAWQILPVQWQGIYLLAVVFETQIFIDFTSYQGQHSCIGFEAFLQYGQL